MPKRSWEVYIDYQDGDMGTFMGYGTVIPQITQCRMDRDNEILIRPGFVRILLRDGSVRDFPKSCITY